MNTKIASKKGLDWSSLIGSLMIKIPWKGIVSCETSKCQRFGCEKNKWRGITSERNSNYRELGMNKSRDERRRETQISLPYSGLKILLMSRRNHSFVSPPISSPGSPANVTFSFFFKSLCFLEI